MRTPTPTVSTSPRAGHEAAVERLGEWSRELVGVPVNSLEDSLDHSFGLVHITK